MRSADVFETGCFDGTVGLKSMFTQSSTCDLSVEVVIRKLLAYCRANQWAGYDPYDALNSRLIRLAPLLDARIPRLCLTQALKRSPVNVRHLLLVPRTQNAKGMALFLSAFVNLSEVGVPILEREVDLMIERLIGLRSKGVPYWCWGYSFPWQTRTVLVPAGAPNLVCTAFVSNALLDVYQRHGDSRCLEMAVSAAEYMVNVLYWEGRSPSGAGFSYPMPGLRSRTHNANFLGASLLCRVYKLTREARFLGPALTAARYSAGEQKLDGSWAYGEAASQQWIDNFHTGYNLCALRAICRDAETAEFESYVRRGFEFYRSHFFRNRGAVRYFHNRDYPIDTHCVAQSIITLVRLKDLDPRNVSLAHLVLGWTMRHMWDDRGFFYYRALRFCTVRISYMRWTQAWMLLALSMLMAESGGYGKAEA